MHGFIGKKPDHVFRDQEIKIIEFKILNCIADFKKSIQEHTAIFKNNQNIVNSIIASAISAILHELVTDDKLRIDIYLYNLFINAIIRSNEVTWGVKIGRFVTHEEIQ